MVKQYEDEQDKEGQIIEEHNRMRIARAKRAIRRNGVDPDGFNDYELRPVGYPIRTEVDKDGNVASFIPRDWPRKALDADAWEAILWNISCYDNYVGASKQLPDIFVVYGD